MRLCLQNYRIGRGLTEGWRLTSWVVATILFVAGCALKPPEMGGILAGAPVLRGTGEWDDVHAAVLVGAEKSECAIVKVYEPSPDVRLFRLETVRSETAWLEVSRISEGEGGAEVRMQARIGRFGDVERERALMARIAERLRRLAGVDYRPVP